MNLAQLIDPEKVYRADPLATRPSPLAPLGAILHSQTGDAALHTPAKKSMVQLVCEALGASAAPLTYGKVAMDVAGLVPADYVYAALDCLVRQGHATRDGVRGSHTWQLTDVGRKRLGAKC